MVLREQGKCSVDMIFPLHCLSEELIYLGEDAEQSEGWERREQHERRVILQRSVEGGRPARTRIEQDQATITQVTTVTLCDNVRKVFKTQRFVSVRRLRE